MVAVTERTSEEGSISPHGPSWRERQGMQKLMSAQGLMVETGCFSEAWGTGISTGTGIGYNLRGYVAGPQ